MASRHFSPTGAEHATQRSDGWLDADTFQPRREEREFVNWVCAQHDDWTAMYLRTTATLRHGLSLLQRVAAPPTSKVSDLAIIATRIVHWRCAGKIGGCRSNCPASDPRCRLEVR